MSEEQNEQTQQAEEPKKAAEAKSGGLMSYLLYGGIGLVVVAATIFGTLMILGPATPETSDAGGDGTIVAADSVEADSHGDTSADQHAATPAEGPDTMYLEDDDTPVHEEIEANLEFLDYRPADSEMGPQTMSKEDSVAAVDWLAEEKKRLTTWEKQLTARQKELEILDKKVSQKILRIEQAESAKIQSLAKLYDNMDARSVAKLCANLDDATVVSLLPRMKQKNASQVLALLPAQRAARLSKQMITIAGN